LARIARALTDLALVTHPTHWTEAATAFKMLFLTSLFSVIQMAATYSTVEASQSTTVGSTIRTLIQGFALNSVCYHVQPIAVNLFHISYLY
jgi:hypothetical protein